MGRLVERPVVTGWPSGRFMPLGASSIWTAGYLPTVSCWVASGDPLEIRGGNVLPAAFRDSQGQV